MSLNAKQSLHGRINVGNVLVPIPGADGATFTPALDSEGNLSWSNDKDLPNPESVNIKGPKGDPGNDYVLTDEDKNEIAELAAGMVEVPEGSGGIAVTGAKVGQTVKISEVDENGVPTAWESVDFPSGGDELREWEEFIRFTTDNAETMVFDFSSNGTETLESKKVKEFYLYSPNCNSGDCTGVVTINESITINNLLNFCRGTGTLKLSLAVSPEALKFRYFGRDTDLHFNTPAATFVTMMGQSIGGNIKAYAFNITEMRDGIAFPSSSVDYIKTVTVTLQSPCLSGVEFIVYVR